MTKSGKPLGYFMLQLIHKSLWDKRTDWLIVQM